MMPSLYDDIVKKNKSELAVKCQLRMLMDLSGSILVLGGSGVFIGVYAGGDNDDFQAAVDLSVSKPYYFTVGQFV